MRIAQLSESLKFWTHIALLQKCDSMPGRVSFPTQTNPFFIDHLRSTKTLTLSARECRLFKRKDTHPCCGRRTHTLSVFCDSRVVNAHDELLLIKRSMRKLSACVFDYKAARPWSKPLGVLALFS